jgi:hypothetical protein
VFVCLVKDKKGLHKAFMINGTKEHFATNQFDSSCTSMFETPSNMILGRVQNIYSQINLMLESWVEIETFKMDSLH